MANVADISEERQQVLSISIPVFPPFKLRSSLIDKDPVIWEYLLADYITLFKKLLALIPHSTNSKRGNGSDVSAPFTLSINTVNQLHAFLQSFLHESSLESTQVFSLGAINPNIRENQHILKLAVFSYIKAMNLVNLKLTGASIWDFCKVYVTMADKYSSQKINQTLVTIPVIRKLIQGTVKSLYTSKSDDVSLLKSLHVYMGKLIASGKWKQDDSEVLYLLLGQRTKKGLASSSSGDRNKKKNIKNIRLSSTPNSAGVNNSDFAELFVNKHWAAILEELYVGGTGMNFKVCVQIMVLSLCSLSSPKIVKLLKDQLEIDGLAQLKQLYPLISLVVLSKQFNEMNPDLKDMLSPILLSLKKKDSKGVTGAKVFDGEKIRNVIEMFPQLSPGKVKTLLANNNNEVEKVINDLLEMDVEDMSTIEDYDEQSKESSLKHKNKKKAKPGNVFDFQMAEDKVVTVQLGKKEADNDLDEVDEDLRKKNLERALALLYDADEDEPDDTYVENEGGSIPDLDYNEDDGGTKNTGNDNNVNIKLDKKLLEVEAKLFGIYSSSPDRLKRTDRNTPYRQELRREIGWTDEQIEGWARVIEKNPRRFRMLEERLVYVDGSLNKSGKKSTKWSAPKEDSQEAQGTKGDGPHMTDKGKGGRPGFTASKSVTAPSVKNNKNFRAYMEKKKKEKKEKAN